MKNGFIMTTSNNDDKIISRGTTSVTAEQNIMSESFSCLFDGSRLL